jgi:hypothetical protein
MKRAVQHSRHKQKADKKQTANTCIHIHTIRVYIHTPIYVYKLPNSMEQSRVQKLIAVPQTVKKFLAFCRSRRFIILFTRVRLLPLTWNRSAQSTYYHYINLSCILIYLSHIGTWLPRCLFLSDFFTIHCKPFYSLSYVSHAPFTYYT